MIKSFGNKTKVAVFISGRGTNLKSLFYFSRKKKIEGGNLYCNF